jgi:light-regulated signal transduction histidine kinase (bacteriophytochrome)
MKASMSRTEDTESLQDLGRASMQIVHDLKNQLNGLKLYATFLRKRIEKSDRPGDEQETIAKLISGLDRAASDLSMIVQVGREVELKKQPGFELAKVLRNLCSSFQEGEAEVVCESDADSIQGDFDHSKLTDAFKSMFEGAIKFKSTDEQAEAIKVSLKSSGDNAVIEWSGLRPLDHDPFRTFAGSDEIRLALAKKIFEAHGGSTKLADHKLVVVLPLSGSQPS